MRVRSRRLRRPSAVGDAKTEAVKYTYEFSQPKFVVNHIVLEHDAKGRGTVTFERMNEIDSRRRANRIVTGCS